ncbi:MAG: hypothetical protein ACR2G3_03430 [Solirubrobacterales bacterium]
MTRRNARSFRRSKATAFAVILAYLAAAHAPGAHAADPGDLDLSFAGDGKLTGGFAGSPARATAVQIQTDGKIVVAGTANGDFALARYKSDGSFDTTFSGDGRVTTDFGPLAIVDAAAIQPDGRIVVVGTTYPPSTGADDSELALARYKTDGTLDTSFAGDGKRTVDFGFDEEASAVAIQADGKIVVAGGDHSLVGTDDPGDFGVFRFTSGGSADTSFGGDGKVTTGFDGANDTATSVAIQEDGKIVAAGIADPDGDFDFDFALARYTTSGSLDASFNFDGKVNTGFGRSDRILDVAIQDDGKIVAAGDSADDFSGANADFALARYTTSGFPDTGFDGDGRLTTDFGGAENQATGVAIQADDRIIAAGSTQPGSSHDFALARYTTSGALSTSFGGDGRVTTGFGGDDTGHGVAIQTNGRIVAAGSSTATGVAEFALARYHAATDNPPDTVIDSGPTGTTSDSTPTFGFHSTESSSTFQCAIDAGAFSSCTSPRTTASLLDGPHTFRVRAIDSAAQTDPTPATRSFTVDTTPNTLIDSGASGPTNDPTPTFAFHSTEPGSNFACAIDTGTYLSCTSPHTTATLLDGPHTFRVRAIDTDGTPNTDPTPAERSFTVDTVAPDTVIDSGPPAVTDDPTPTFTFHSSEVNSTLECAIDTGTFASCTSPRTTPTLSDGPHTFRVRAKDAAQNLDATPAEHEFSVDTTAPNTVIDSGPPDPTNDPTPTFDFRSTESNSTFQCAIDAGAFEDCTSPHTTEELLDGPHTFRVQATDSTAHTDPTPAQLEFTLDTVPPDTAIVSGPSGEIHRRTARFRFDALGEQAAGFECRLDDGDWSSCSSPHEYAHLRLGAHVFRVRALDSAGNADPLPAKRRFTVVA